MIMMGFHGSLTISIPSSDILVLTKAASRRIGNRLLNGRSFCDSATTTIYLIAHSIQCFEIRKKVQFRELLQRIESLIKGLKITVDFRLLSLPMPSQTHFFIALFLLFVNPILILIVNQIVVRNANTKGGITFSQTVRK